jgi:hypothetical protein
MSAAYTVQGDFFAAGKPLPWSNKQVADVEPAAWVLDLTPDGKRFVAGISRADSAGEPKVSVQVTFLLNFFDEVRRRIPAAK